MSEKERWNAEGAERGCYACPACGDYLWGGANFHTTTYSFGVRHTSDIADPDQPGSKRVSWDGDKGIVALCEVCFASMTPEERLPHYLARVDAWRETIPSVKRVPTAGAGLQDDPLDALRFADELARHEATRRAVADAVLAGE